MRSVGRRGDDQQRADLAESGDETPPSRVREQLVVVERAGAGGHDEQLAGVGHLLRDARQGDAEEEAVDEAVRIVAGDERLKRRCFAEQIADRDTPMHRLHAGDAERGLGRRDRIDADDDHRMERIERDADAPPLLGPVHRAGRAHGPPS